MTTTGTRTFDLPGFGGQLIHPGESGYDEARAVFNGMIDRRPAVIAVCTSVDDVVAAVNYARESGLPISVYGGGHSVTGASVVDEGICIDMRGMKGISVDPAARTVRAEAGLNWGEFDAATQEHGLAVTGGRVPDTGIAGLALGSGSGWLERKLGFTCDNLLAAELVTADGRIVPRVGHREPRALLGTPRWRRQLRHRHRVPPATAPHRADRARRVAGVPGADGPRPRALLARLHAHCARRGRQCARVHHRAARRLRARAGARTPRRRRGASATPARSRKARRCCARCASSGLPASTWCSPCRTPRCRISSPSRTRTACATTGTPTSSPSCPTPRSTRWWSTPRSRCHR